MPVTVDDTHGEDAGAIGSQQSARFEIRADPDHVLAPGASGVEGVPAETVSPPPFRES